MIPPGFLSPPARQLLPHMSERLPQSYEFGPFRLDPGEGLLTRGPDRISLTPKAFETLVALVERSGRLVEKDELMKAVWPDTFVEEANLTNNIWALRKALGEIEAGQSYIETVPKRGYRFNANVRPLTVAGEPVVIERQTRTVVVTEEHEHEVSFAELTTGPATDHRHWFRRSFTLATVVLCVLVGVLVVISQPWKPRPAERVSAAPLPAGPRSIVVLPVRPIGAEATDQYLSLGLADALITRLGNVNQLVVRPTSAIRRYVDAPGDPTTIGRQQNVDAVLDGSFQRVGDRIRLTVQLVRVSDGSTIWSSQFDERFTDILSVQDSISERVACDLVTRICGEDAARFARQKKISIEAYEAYLKGRYFWNRRTMEGFQKAAENFRRAIDIEPAYARAYAGLGDAYYFLSGYDRASGETYARARAALQRALELDEHLSEPHATLGLMAMNNEWNWPEAEKEFKKAIELSPNYATAHQWYGEFLAYMGRSDESIREVSRARELDPLSTIINTDFAKVHLLARRYDEATKLFQSALELDPTFDEAHALLALTHSLSGRHQLAVDELLKVQQLEASPGYLSFLAYIYGKAGEREKAIRVQQQIKALSNQMYVSPYWWTFVSAGLADEEQTLAQLEKMFYEKAPPGPIALKVSPILDMLSTNPRYTKLLQRAGFTE
jgi:DNA-binding winged helix-turn-helix (wHTH) protein/TolB-like protein/Tfp pilus assembly protein PilF